MTLLLTVEVDAIEVGSEDDFALILGSVLISGMGLLVECGEPEEGDEDLLAQSFLNCAVALSGSHDSGLIDIGRLFYCLGRRLAAEAASLVRTSAALLPAIDRTPAPVATDRGPPADVVAPAPAKSPGGFKSLYRTGAPSMVSDTRKAPLRALSQTFHPAACPAQTAYQPRTLCAVVCCAAGPNRDGRYVLAVD